MLIAFTIIKNSNKLVYWTSQKSGLVPQKAKLFFFY